MHTIGVYDPRTSWKFCSLSCTCPRLEPSKFKVPVPNKQVWRWIRRGRLVGWEHPAFFKVFGPQMNKCSFAFLYDFQWFPSSLAAFIYPLFLYLKSRLGFKCKRTCKGSDKIAAFSDLPPTSLLPFLSHTMHENKVGMYSPPLAISPSGRPGTHRDSKGRAGCAIFFAALLIEIMNTT